MKKRVFTMIDQKNFALFSGDFNPIHVDEIKSTKTHAGQPIAHGVHQVLWVLDAFKIKLRCSDKISISFKSQINISDEVCAEFNESIGKILITNSDNQKIHSEINLNTEEDYNSSKPKNDQVFFTTFNLKPEAPEIHQLKLKKKYHKLYGGSQIEIGKTLFPFLVNDIGLNIVYEFACLSSIVGMKMPGMHSLFVNLNISFPHFENHKSYLEVINKHENLNLISLNYSGINLKSEIKAFYRPKPIETMSIKNLKINYENKNSLNGKKILVIGGSRGIGAYVVKLCSIMGASVTFTYNSNYQDAENIASEVIKNGATANFFKLNVTNIDDLKKIDDRFDQIYYFATPKIFPNSSEETDYELQKKYHLFYVEYFEKVLNTFIPKNASTKFLYPSTTYIDDKNNFKEYIFAKIQGEKLCEKYIKDFNAIIYYPRIPPLDTDQNLSILPSKNEKSSVYAYKLIGLVSNNDTSL